MAVPNFPSRMMLAAVSVVMLGLSGCATDTAKNFEHIAADVPPPTFAARFELRARLSVRTADKLDVVNIHWRRTPPDETLKISTPFGTQLAELAADQHGAVMRRADQPNTPVRAVSVSELMAEGIGVRLDTADLARWVQGFDLQGGEFTKKWDVKVENFRIINGARVASRLTAVAGDTVVRVVIDEFWVR